MSFRLLWVGCLVALCSAGFPERPALADDAAKARELYRKGKAHFAVGEYEAAAQDYQNAYKLKPDHALLYNAAQAYRLGGKLDRALTLYRNYLRFYPDASNAENVRGQIAKLEQQIEAERTAVARPAPAATAPPPVTTPPPPSGSEAPVVIATAPAPEPGRSPVYKKAWFWGVVGGVAAAVLVVAVMASSSGGGSWNNLPEVRELHSGAVVQW